MILRQTPEIGEFMSQICDTNSPISEFGKAEVNFLTFFTTDSEPTAVF